MDPVLYLREIVYNLSLNLCILVHFRDKLTANLHSKFLAILQMFIGADPGGGTRSPNNLVVRGGGQYRHCPPPIIAPDFKSDLYHLMHFALLHYVVTGM